MEGYVENSLDFVLLIEEHKAILQKSKKPAALREKENAVNAIIEKWKNKSGKKLARLDLLKKINNLKERSKAAAKRRVTLNDWQRKLLELANESSINTNPDRPNTRLLSDEGNRNDKPGTHEMKADVSTKAKADDLVTLLETDETQLIDLKRHILLLRSEVLTLLKQKLENEMNITGDFDFENIDFTNFLLYEVTGN